MIMSNRFAFLLLLPLLLASCNFDTKLKYVETQCADEWAYDTDQIQHKNNIRGYLDMKGIETGEITLANTPDTEMTCQSCDCPSNRTVYITISADDKAKALALGFVEY
jgi:hypothetical protein